jgi:hypothetical protein
MNPAAVNVLPFDHEPKIVIGGARHLPARDIARTYGYVPDYVARLCRQNRVRGRKLGSLWYVDVESFAAFVRRNDSPAAQEASHHNV